MKRKICSGLGRGARRLVMPPVIALGALAAVSSAEAATITVNTFNDGTTTNGQCSLREAILFANLTPPVGNHDCTTGSASGNTIVLAAGTHAGAGTYVIGGATPLDVSRTLTIQGPSMWTATIRADLTGPHAIGVVAPGGNLTMTNVTLAKGTQNAGVTGLTVAKQIGAPLSLTLDHVQVTGFTRTGIINDAGMLKISFSTISNNSNDENGGGIAVLSDANAIQEGNLLMDHSAVLNNAAFFGSGGGLFRTGTGVGGSTVWECTFSGNHADIRGGAIYSGTLTFTSDYLQLTHLTIANNSADSSGGGITEDDALSGSIRLDNSIVNDNTAPQAMDVEGSFYAHWSIVTEVDGLYSGDTSDSRIGAQFNARLSPLMFNGGPTQVRPLTPQPPGFASPAIDFGPAGDPEPNDQRNYARPKNGSGAPTAIADVGAYEFDPAPTIFQSENEPVLAKSSDTYSIVSNASYSNGKGVNLAADFDGDFITFPVGTLLPGTYNVRVRVKTGNNEGTFQLSKSTTLNGTYTPIGTTKDLYTLNNTWVELNISSTVSLTQGQAYFKFTVTGKNAASSGRQLFIDYVKVTKL